ncbi:CD109 antigen [Eublepharis macularius]|uniref:CD109 antigen n=1 Tax=Eublepharis macularius TaxID=481883 RepID=A0AA97LB30_EUBMA|nr:CD109 antigen [Eublepharis macularius]
MPDCVHAARKGSLLPSTIHLALCFLTVSRVAAAGPGYLLTAPLTFRPGTNMSIGVALLKNSPPHVTVKAEVVFDNNTVLWGEAVFQRDSFGTLVLPALPLGSPAGDYNLLVKGYTEGVLLFSNHSDLSFEHKSFSVFIQTDKSMYKPGQDVKIRIVTLHPDLKPLSALVNLYIRDPRRNLIQQWLAENGKLGKISKEFKISRYPVLGDWSIQVEVNDQTHYQTFTVMEYVLPKFEVILATPLFYSSKAERFSGAVTAKYTYGKPVKGKVTVTCFSSSWDRNKNITKELMINGSVNFTLDNQEIQAITSRNGEWDLRYVPPVEIVAVVTESLTGISQNASTTIFPKYYDYILEFSEYPKVLKPSLTFIATLKVTRADKNPLSSDDRQNNVMISVRHSEDYMYGYGNELQTEEKFNYSVPENGIIQIEFPVLVNTTSLKVKAKFLDGQTSIIINDVFFSPSTTYLLIKKTSQDVKVGSPLELSVKSNKPVTEISYMVVSKEQIVVAGKTELQSSAFTLTPENSWAPMACIIAYYVSDSGEVINDALNVPVHPVFKNQINMYWSKNKAKPSENVTLKINVTELRTTIGLLVVDRSTKLIGKRSDISEDAIHHELSLYNTAHYDSEAQSSYNVFQKCNLWVFTDASLPRYRELIDDHDLFFLMGYSEESELQNHLETTSVVDFGNPHVRTNFPETWIWNEITPRSTEVIVNVTVPDTITSWLASAFIISENLGLGITKIPIELEVFQPFFVSLNLPPSIIRGEQFLLEVHLFNYMKESSEVTVTLDRSDTFEIFISNDINATDNQRSVWMPSEDGKTVVFPIKPTQIGEIPIRVTAVSAFASDAIIQKVLVKAEGLEQFHSQTLLLDLTKRVRFGDLPPPATETLSFTFPSEVVPGSERVQFTIVGDMLGPSISGLASLIKMPYGCGEQNMINFAPNIYVLDYLTKTGELKHNTKLKAVSYMREGYQRELLFQRDDGSFSAFGNDDHAGSTWLSAFVLRSFFQAQPYIDIDPYILERTAAWIVNHQAQNGEFLEPGRVLHSELQGGTNSPVSLTAYIMAALLEYQTQQYDRYIRKALNFLEMKLSEGISDNYTLALVTYALSLAKSPQAKTALNLLNDKAEHQGELRFWRSPSAELSDSWQPHSTDTELAGYALLSHVKQQRLLEGLSIMKWLLKQRNSLGGYSSTQDTIVALQALSACAVHTAGHDIEMDVTVHSVSEENPFVYRLDNKNRIVLKSKEIAATQPVEVTVSTSGHGFGIFQLNIVYNVKNPHNGIRSTQSQEAFDLDVLVKDDKKDINHVTLNVCTRYLGTGTSSKTGMALMEIGLLSGFALSPAFVPPDDMIRKVEKAEGKVHLYLNHLNKTEFCVDVPTVRYFKVANTQDASVNVVDYYEPRRRAVRSYNSEVMQSVSSCAFCENDCDFCGTRSDSSSPISLSCELFVVHISLLYVWLV